MKPRFTSVLILLVLGGLAMAGAGLLAATRERPCTAAANAPSGSISGRVIDASTRTAMVSASVRLLGTPCGTTTDVDGRFRFEHLRADTFTVELRRLGYGAVRLSGVKVVAGRDTSLSVQMNALAMQLGDVSVGAQANHKYALSASSPAVRIRGAASMAMAASPAAMEAESADELLLIDAVAAAPPSGMGRREMAKQRGLARMDVDGRTAEPDVPATQGTLRARTPDGTPLGDFPLQHTDVAIEVSGSLARTVVEQRYANPYDEVIEAVYVFPLPSFGAVNDFVMRVGSRKIVGLVRTRAEAERIYADARARGQTASLLTQERPNIFTQSVANIEPGGTVTISITYFERLPYENGQYELVFPMVVGPRYIPGTPDEQTVAQQVGREPGGEPRRGGGGWSPSTDRVPDADRITPPVLRPGERSGHDISLSVNLDAGLPITKLAAIAHQVEIERVSPTRQIVRLATADAIPNRDFVLRWSVAGAETRFGVLAHGDDGRGYFSLTMQPPLAPSDEQVMPREVTFILDVSGSMMGMPVDIAKGLIGRTLDELRPDDQFNIVYFASGNAQLWERAQPNTRANVEAAKKFLENLQAGGGTEMLAGLRRALSARHDPEFLQMYVFLTDGYVGDEENILRVVKEERGDARFFGFGIGSSVNRYLIDGIGEHGGGMSEIVIPRDSAHSTRAVRRLFDAIDSPVLVDIAIDWNGLPVADVYPARLRDLFAGQVIDVVGRYTGPASGTAYVTGRIGTRRVRYPVRVELPAKESRHAALAPTWARLRIHDLSGDMLTADAGGRARLERQITELALEHHLVSQFTSFVAVDSSRIVGDGEPLRVMQPVELPEGVSYEGIFGEKPSGSPVRIGAWGVTLTETESGKVRVAEIVGGSAAAEAGVRRGAEIESVNGTAVHGLAHLEGLLLQSSARSLRVVLKPGGESVLPAP